MGFEIIPAKSHLSKPRIITYLRINAGMDTEIEFEIEFGKKRLSIYLNGICYFVVNIWLVTTESFSTEERSRKIDEIWLEKSVSTLNTFLSFCDYTHTLVFPFLIFFGTSGIFLNFVSIFQKYIAIKIAGLFLYLVYEWKILWI